MALNDADRAWLESRFAAQVEQTKGLSEMVTDHCLAQAATNQQYRDALNAARERMDEHVQNHKAVVKTAWGLISGVILAIISGVGSILWNILKGDQK
jgi:uncharacterized coiled-coil protein SlyX